jgi:short-subunit dehydrogenase
VRRGARLYLVGRSPAKLEALVDELSRDAGAGGGAVSSRAADLAKLEQCGDIIDAASAALGGIDVALIAHGDLGDQLESERSFEAAEAILRVNFMSAVALLIPLANVLEAQGFGTVGVITSVAGDRGRPRNYTYGTAKGALNVFLQGLRSRLWHSGVRVVTLKLGPVDTPMTRDHRKNVLFGEPGAIARSIAYALEHRRGEAYVPAFWALIMPIVRHTPERLFQLLPFLSGR